MHKVIARMIEKAKVAIEAVPKPWKRTTKAEKYHAKYIGRLATEFRGRKAKQRGSELKLARKIEIQQMKRSLGRRLTPEEMQAAAIRVQPQLAAM